MAMVIGYRLNGKVLIATDTQRSREGKKWTSLIPSAMSVTLMPGGILVGSVGYLAYRQAIFSHPEWFEGIKGPLSHEALITKIVPHYYRELERLEQLDEDRIKQGRSKIDGALLFAQGDRLYCMDGDFHVTTIDRWCGIGETSQVLCAKMALIRDLDDEEEAVRTLVDSLSFVEANSTVASAPFVLFETGKEGYRIIKEATK